jgi:hypothetical protein
MATAKLIPMDRIVAGSNISITTGNAQLTIASSGGGGNSFPVNTATLANNTFKTIGTMTALGQYGCCLIRYVIHGMGTIGTGTTSYRVTSGILSYAYGATINQISGGSQAANTQLGTNGSGSMTVVGDQLALSGGSAPISIRCAWSYSGGVKSLVMKWQFEYQIKSTS